MRNRLTIALVLIASLLLAVPAVSASEVADPVMAKLESILAAVTGVQKQYDALSQRMEALEKQVAEIHEVVVPTEEAAPETLIIRSDGITPIAFVEADDYGTFELLDLKEQGNDVVARIRIRTSNHLSKTYSYLFYLESGKSRFDPDPRTGTEVPPGTTREYTVTFKKAAGTLTPDGYVSVYRAYWGEIARIYLAPQK